MKSDASFTNVAGGRLQKAVRKELDKSTKGQTVKRLKRSSECFVIRTPEHEEFGLQ